MNKIINTSDSNGYELWLGDQLEGIFSSTIEISKYLNLPLPVVNQMLEDEYEDSHKNKKWDIYTILDNREFE